MAKRRASGGGDSKAKSPNVKAGSLSKETIENFPHVPKLVDW